MEKPSKAAGILTPVKTPQKNQSKDSILHKVSENENPNHKKSPLKKSVSVSKSIKSGSKNHNPSGNSLLVKSRKFVVAKKSKKSDALNKSKEVCKCSNGNGKLMKCLCVAYESLMASQEGFLKNRVGIDFDGMKKLNFGDDKIEGVIRNAEIQDFAAIGDDGDCKIKGLIQNAEIGKGCVEIQDFATIGDDGDNKIEGLIQNGGIGKGCAERGDVDAIGEEGVNEMRVSAMKRSRDRLLEEARECVPEPGFGRVMHLVKAFEKLKMVSNLKSKEAEVSDEKEGESKCVKWALPGMQGPPEAQLLSSSFCPSDLFLTSECLGLDSCRSSSLDNYRGRNSSDSSLGFARRIWRKKRQLKTTAKPLKLRTEERGKCKKEEFMKKVQHMMEEEEKLRVPIAEGLPWTTDEPEHLAKPPVKEATRPIDLVLHSDIRAEERAEFDHQVAEKMSIIEQYRMEKERQQKLAEEEEIKRLRKELVPKAQPMPYFDRPFTPRRSEKQPTIPKEPKFHIPQHKKIKCTQQSWSDTCAMMDY